MSGMRNVKRGALRERVCGQTELKGRQSISVKRWMEKPRQCASVRCGTKAEPAA